MEELAVRDSTLVVIRMKRREMEVVVSICFLVEDRGLNSIFRNAQVDIDGSSVSVIVDVSELKCWVEVRNKVN